MASSSRIRQTVLRLMGLFSSARARWARSVVDWRLRGFPVRATTSQAIDVIMALSRGGKDRLTAPARVVLESEPAFGPASAPTADGVGVEIEMSGGCRGGKGGGVVEGADQTSALPEGWHRRASEEGAPGLGEELIRKGRVMKRRRARHGTTPRAVGQMVFSDESANITAACMSRQPYRLL